MTNISRFAALSAVALAVAGTLPGVLATPISASLSVSANAVDDGYNNGNPVTQTGGESWGALDSTLSDSVTAVSGNNISYANAVASFSAGGDSGSVVVNYGITTPDAGGVGSSQTWIYRFTADATGTFTFDYNLNVTGNPWAMGLWQIYLIQGSSFVMSDSPGGAGAAYPLSGSNTGTLTAGDTYYFDIISGPNIGGGLGSGWDGSETATFDFTLPGGSNVPDSANTLVMLTASLSGLAAFRRRFAK